MKTRIKELRLEKKLTQQSLATHLGVNQTTVSKLENETTTPDAMLLTRLSRFFTSQQTMFCIYPSSV